MIGGASAGLLGLMFVALSLGMNLVTAAPEGDFKAFVTPSVFYFTSALLICAALLNPAYTPSGLSLILFAGGSFGLVWTLRHVPLLFRVAKRNQDFTLDDWLSEIILPPVDYILVIIAAICFAADQWQLALNCLWIGSILLLVTAILNTWSLVIWIIDQRK